MASIYKRGSTWWLRYEVNGMCVRESLLTHDKAKAKMALAARMGDVTRLRAARRMGLDVPEDTREAKLTLPVFLERYREHFVGAGGGALRTSRERTWRADASALKPLLTFLERQGVKRVSKVARRHVEAFRDWRASATVLRAVPIPQSEIPAQRKGKPGPKPKLAKTPTRLVPRPISGATVNKSLRVAKAAWSWAVRIGISKENPFKGVPLVSVPKSDPRNLSEFEIRKVFDAARKHALAPLLATAVYAGLRMGELVALEWTDVDFKENLIRVRCDETFLTKSRKPRLVPLAPDLRGVLEPIAQKAGLCFPSATGTRRDPDNVYDAVIRIGRRAGVEFTPHDLRRTFAGLLAERGVPMTRVRDYLGHSSVSTTESYYVGRGRVDHADVASLALGNGHKSGHTQVSEEPRTPGVA